MSESDENKNGPVATGPEQTDNQAGEVLLAKPEEAIAFLQMLYRNGPWTLVAIQPDTGRISAKTFRPGDEATMAERIAERNRTHNLYYQLNPTIQDLDKKAKREDILEIRWLHADLDPRAGEDIAAERDRMLAALRSFRLPPTFIVNSGNGVQAGWALREPIAINGDVAKADDVALFNLALALALGGDRSTQNVDRILRLVGTVNWPNKQKRAKGRVQTMASLVEYHTDRVYDIAQFEKATAPARAQVDASATGDVPALTIGSAKRLPALDGLPVSDRCKMVIAQGYDPLEPNRWNSRSEPLLWVCCELVRAGVSDDTIFSVITDPGYLVSGSVVDKGSSHAVEKYARRQIERAKAEVISPELRELNDKHFVIGNIGGKCRVMEDVYDEVLKRASLTKSSFEDFRNRYMNKLVAAGTDSNGLPRMMPKGRWWLEHPMRQQYDRIVFSPRLEVAGAYNLWQGFAVSPMPGDCSLFLAHLRDNVCGGNDEYYAYLIGWMARCVQQPDTAGQTAIVLRGKMGTGKGVVANWFGSLWGRHYLKVSDAKHLIGHFNAHLRDCIVLFADEAFYAGDVKHEGILKSLITEDTLTIEGKGTEVESASNFLHMIMSSNETWVVPVGLNDRRFFVLEVSTAHMQDGAYFAAIENQMRAGGREALLHFLLTYDLSSFDVRKFPRTAAHRDQQLESLRGVDKLWYRVLSSGMLPCPIKEGPRDDGSVIVSANLLHQGFLSMLKTSSEPSDAKALSFQRVSALLGQPKNQPGRPKTENGRATCMGFEKSAIEGITCWHLPALAKAREAWDSARPSGDWDNAAAADRWQSDSGYDYSAF